MRAWLSTDGSDGSLVDLTTANVSILDRVVTVGAGVFETVKVSSGNPFALTRHIARLQQSASTLGIRCPAPDVLRHAVSAVIAAHGPDLSLGRMRITVTGGPGSLADPYSSSGEPGWFITLTELPAWPSSAVVALSPFRRNEHSALVGVKSTSYAENAVALRNARSQGADEALLLNTSGDVCEGTGSNIFVVIDDVLCTPELTSGCLAGVTRGLVLRCADVQERPIAGSELARVSEAFLTSSTRDIWPIRKLAGRGLTTAGPHTRAAQTAWNSDIAVQVDP